MGIDLPQWFIQGPDVQTINATIILLRVHLKSVEEDSSLVALLYQLEAAKLLLPLEILINGQVKLTVIEVFDFIHVLAEVGILQILTVDVGLFHDYELLSTSYFRNFDLSYLTPLY